MIKLVRAVLVALVMLGFGPVSAAGAAEPDLTGIWEVTGQTSLYGYFHFFVDIRRTRLSNGAPAWEAIKRTDTRNVPSQERHFLGQLNTFTFKDRSTGEDVTRTYLDVEVQVALPGFLQPRMERQVFEIKSADVVELSTETTSQIVRERDEDGNEDLGTDRWTYRKWDARTFRVSAPTVRDTTFRVIANQLKNEVRELRRDVASLEGRISREEARLVAIINDDRDGRRERELWGAKEAALERWQRSQETRQPEAPPVPAPLKRLTDHLAELTIRKTSIEDQIVQVPEGRNRNTRITDLFNQISLIDRQIGDTQAAIRRVARENNVEVPRPGTPVVPRPEGVAAAEAEYDQAFRAWWEQNRRNKMRPVLSEAMITELEQLRARKEELEASIAKKEAAAKGYDNGRQISTVIVGAEGSSSGGAARHASVVLEAVPSDIDVELHDLKEKYDDYRNGFLEIQEVRSENLARFNGVSEEITDLRDEMVGKIRSSAHRQAMVEFVGNFASAAVSWGTGGAAGAMIDAIFTVVWTCAWNEDCVAFTNYDESQMQSVFERRRQEMEAQQRTNENATCSFLPALEKVDGEHRLPQWARAPSPGASTLPELKLVPVGNSTSQRLDLSSGLMTVPTGVGIGLREAAMNNVNERARVWFNGQIRDANTRLLLHTQLKAAQERAIREALIRTTEQIVQEEAADAARRASVDSARSILSDPAASREAAVRAQRIIQEQLPIIRQTEQLSRLNVPRAFENLDELDELIKKETEALAKMSQKLGDIDGALKHKMAKAGINVLAGVAIGYTKSVLQEEIKEGERDLWAEIFAKQLEASVYFNAYQRASCLYWTRLDQLAWIQRAYAPLYFAYDQNAAFKVLIDSTFTDDQSLLVQIGTRSPDTALGARTTVGGVPCRRISATSCRVDASAWRVIRDRRPTLDLVIDLEPRAN